MKNADGYIGLQSEVDGGGQFEFRNFELTDLDFQPLFNGRDLTGWIGATAGYTVEDGAIVSRKDSGGNLYTTSEHANFSYRFDFKLSPGGNNGVGIRAPLTGDSAFAAMEIQILDDGNERYRTIAPWQVHGSIYGVVPAKRGFLKPVGEWNHEEIIARGRHVTVILNGHTIVDANLDEAVKDGKTLDGKAHPGLANTQGHIGFLGHGTESSSATCGVKDYPANSSGAAKNACSQRRRMPLLACPALPTQRGIWSLLSKSKSQSTKPTAALAKVTAPHRRSNSNCKRRRVQQSRRRFGSALSPLLAPRACTAIDPFCRRG